MSRAGGRATKQNGSQMDLNTPHTSSSESAPQTDIQNCLNLNIRAHACMDSNLKLRALCNCDLHARSILLQRLDLCDGHTKSAHGLLDGAPSHLTADLLGQQAKAYRSYLQLLHHPIALTTQRSRLTASLWHWLKPQTPLEQISLFVHAPCGTAQYVDPKQSTSNHFVSCINLRPHAPLSLLARLPCNRCRDRQTHQFTRSL